MSEATQAAARAKPPCGTLLLTATMRISTRCRTTFPKYGSHLLKAGFFYGNSEKVESNGNGADRPGLPGTCNDDSATGGPYCFNTNNSLATILLPGTGPNAQVFSSVGENSIDGIADVHWHDYEFYLGDSWKISRRITLDYGFRWS